jgi:hypothetical protein
MRPYLLASLLLAAGCFVGWAVHPAPPAPAQGGPRRVAWEYAVYYHGDLMALGGKTLYANLNKLGASGYELVAVVPGIVGEKARDVTKQTTFFFKRAK